MNIPTLKLDMIEAPPDPLEVYVAHVMASSVAAGDIAGIPLRTTTMPMPPGCSGFIGYPDRPPSEYVYFKMS